MGDELVIVRGTVVGEPGVPLAGWVAVGKGGQRWLSRTLRIASDDGHEITLDNLDGDALTPIAQREVVWREVEQDARLATLLASDAPAPDVEVKLREAVIRGGDRVAAWGEVADRGYVGGDSQRGVIEGGITKVHVRLLAYGEDCDERLAERKEALLDKERKEAAKAAKRAQQAREAEPPPKADKKQRDPDAPLVANLPLWVALAGLAACAGAAWLTGSYASYLSVAALFAWAPRCLDAMVVPRFRNGRMAPTSLELPFVPWVVIALGATFLTFAMDFDNDVKADTVGPLRIVLLVATVVAGGLTLILSLATRSRRRYLAILANAPAHADPVPDGVWGASIGYFAKQVLLVGETWKRIGIGTGDKATYHTSKFADLDLQGTLLREGKQSVDVQLGDAAILTLAAMSEKIDDRTSRKAELIDTRTPVIAAGRATDGMLRRTGEASLLVFASRPGTDVVHELAALRRREQIGTVLALLGAACLVGALGLRALM